MPHIAELLPYKGDFWGPILPWYAVVLSAVGATTSVLGLPLPCTLQGDVSL